MWQVIRNSDKCAESQPAGRPPAATRHTVMAAAVTKLAREVARVAGVASSPLLDCALSHDFEFAIA